MRKETVGRKGFAAAIAAACLIAAVVLLATSAGGSNGSYTVRAIFDDAGNIISGEDVKIDGVKVGTVGSVTPTPKAKAAVAAGHQQPRLPGLPRGRQLRRPPAGADRREVRRLPADAAARRRHAAAAAAEEDPVRASKARASTCCRSRTRSSPVDVDLLGDISRLPERQRLTIIINELGAGLAGRGSDLNAVIRRANPALRELDRVLAILASENKVLAKLAVDSDKALAPFARVREHFANFLVESNKVSQATAAHRGALAQNLKDFPPFLRQLGPAMERLEKFAEQTTPVFTDLNKAAPGINQTFTSLPAFSNSSEKFFESLGADRASGRGRRSSRPNTPRPS